MKTKLFVGAMLAAFLVACGGNNGDTAKTSGSNGSTTTGTTPKPTTFTPLTTAATATFSGTAATGAPVANAPITVYDAKGVQCGSGTSDSNGLFSVTAKCIFPALISADTPDLQGRNLFAVIPSISSEGQSVPVNITQMTSALLYLTNGDIPAIGSKLSSKIITQEKLVAAQKKLLELLQPVLANLSIPVTQDFQSGPITIGQDQDILLDQVTISFEKLPSTGQALLKLNFPSENRPITLVMDNSSDPTSLRVDTGLGIDPSIVDVQRMSKSKELVKDISSLINGKTSTKLLENYDNCFLHNGYPNIKDDKIIFESLTPWYSTVPTASNFRLHRYNTKIDFENTTDENINNGAGELAYISYDYTSPRGSLSRSFVWVVKGPQTFKNGCTSNSSSWKIAGNQRPVYLRTSPYAIHKIDYNNAFSGRIDTYGSGIELYLEDSQSKYTHALLSGPGLPSDGVLYLKLDGLFVYSPSSLLDLRTTAIAKNNITSIIDTVVDTRGVLILDKNIALIQDAFYASQYTIRLFSDHKDLQPTLTLHDILPKRPQLQSEIKPVNYPSVSVNLDTLVAALQKPEPVTVNWSLPNDSRGYPLQSYMVGFSRKNCTAIQRWPNCSKRSEQFNEYLISKKFEGNNTVEDVITPNTLLPASSKTFESRLRLFALDNLGRPLEVSIGMNYQK